jgi:UDP-3-O-[3-hydroxymyristoyl] glucosamine N-acyltransferase
MLLNYDPTSAVYLIGSGVVADEFRFGLERDNVTNIIQLEYNEWDKVPIGSQCILGFQNCFNKKRMLTADRVTQHRWPTYVHPSAVVDDTNSLGRGCWVGSLTNVSANSIVGDFSVVTSYSNVAHGCRLGRNNFLAPSTIVCGSVTTGDNVSFGVGSIIKDRITIGSNIEFIIDSVVTKDIPDPGRYYGNRSIPQCL